jgi:ribosome-associated protein
LLGGHTEIVPDELEIRPGLRIQSVDLQWKFSRASGPGGQGVNTTDSRVQLSFDLRQLPEPFRSRARASLSAHTVDDVITVVASERRSQFQNRSAATARLIDLLRAATAPPPPRRRRTRPSRTAVESRLADKRRRAGIKRLRRRGPSDPE